MCSGSRECDETQDIGIHRKVYLPQRLEGEGVDRDGQSEEPKVENEGRRSTEDCHLGRKGGVEVLSLRNDEMQKLRTSDTCLDIEDVSLRAPGHTLWSRDKTHS
jgi:hypothetical protein